MINIAPKAPLLIDASRRAEQFTNGENDLFRRRISWWRKALTAQPGLEAARLNIARLLARDKQVEQARKELQRLLEFSQERYWRIAC